MFFDQLSKKAKAKRSDFFTRILGLPIERNAGYFLRLAVRVRIRVPDTRHTMDARASISMLLLFLYA